MITFDYLTRLIKRYIPSSIYSGYKRDRYKFNANMNCKKYDSLGLIEITSMESPERIFLNDTGATQGSVNYDDLNEGQKQAHEIDQLNWNNPQLLRVVVKTRYFEFTLETKEITREFEVQKALKLAKLRDRNIRQHAPKEALMEEIKTILRTHRNDNQPKPDQWVVKINAGNAKRIISKDISKIKHDFSIWGTKA